MISDVCDTTLRKIKEMCVFTVIFRRETALIPKMLGFNVKDLSHPRHSHTRRGVGEGGRPPCLENFQGKLCFQGKRKWLKNTD